MDTNVVLGLSLAFAGCVSVYLASPHQRWLTTSVSARPACVAGIFLLTGGLIALSRALQAAPAVFTWLTWLMLLFTLFPYVGALVSVRRNR